MVVNVGLPLRPSAVCFWEQEKGSYSSDDDLSSLAADVEGQMARFVANTSSV